MGEEGSEGESEGGGKVVQHELWRVRGGLGVALQDPLGLSLRMENAHLDVLRKCDACETEVRRRSVREERQRERSCRTHE